MGEVVNQNWPTRLTVPPEKMLKSALEAGLTEVVIIGFDKNGGWYFASSEADGQVPLYHCSKAIYKLHQMEDKLSE